MASVGILAALVIVLYLLALLRLPPHHLTGLWWSVLAVAVVGTPGLNYLQYRTTRPLVMCLDELAAGGPAPSVPQGFACAVDLPRRIFLLQFTHLQGAAILVIACMAFWFDDFTLRSAALMMAAVLSGGLLSTIVQKFSTCMRKLFQVSVCSGVNGAIACCVQAICNSCRIPQSCRR